MSVCRCLFCFLVRVHSCYVRMSESSVKGVSFGKVAPPDCAEDQTLPFLVVCPMGKEEDACRSGPVWAWLVGKALRRSQETWSAMAVPRPSWILRACPCPCPSLSLSCVTLEWEILIFDPQEPFQFCHLHLYHPDPSQTHTCLVPKPQVEGPAPSSVVPQACVVWRAQQMLPPLAPPSPVLQSRTQPHPQHCVQ